MYNDNDFSIYKNTGFDIASRIKSIELLKLELLENTNSIFQSMGGEHLEAAEAVGETLSALIISAYRLGIFLGVEPKDMDRRIMVQLESLRLRNELSPLIDIANLNKRFSK